MTKKTEPDPVTWNFSASDGFAEHDVTLSGFSRDMNLLLSSPISVVRKVAALQAFKVDIDSTLDAVDEYMRDRGYGSKMPGRVSNKFAAEPEAVLKLIDEMQPLSSDWYAMQVKIKRDHLEELKRSALSVDAAELPSVLDHIGSIAMQLGAICQELRLSQQNRDDTRRGKTDARRRSEGGRARARPDRDEIVRAMRRRLDEGQSITQAARATFEVDGLGASAKANASLWKRDQKKKQDQS